MSLFRIIRLSFYVVFLVAMGLAYYVYVQTLSNPLQNRETTLTIPKGVGVSWLANHLEQQGIIESKYILRAYVWLNENDVSIKAGEYTLVDIESIPQLIDKVQQGSVVQYSLTLVEGKTFKEYIAQLSAHKNLQDELSEMTDDQIMDAMGASGVHPEGQFAPQTYLYQRGDSDLDVLKQAYERQQLTLEHEWAQKSDTVQIKNTYELLIMASIIEKETGAAHERPLISGVFDNRLRIGMRLQTDPTVIYGMGDSYDGNIRRKDLRTDTEYNTYTRNGLPPTPIAMPGEHAIQAAANPQETKALYFVGKGDGTHYFSTNLKEHNNAVIKYQLGGQAKSFSSNPVAE